MIHLCQKISVAAESGECILTSTFVSSLKSEYSLYDANNQSPVSSRDRLNQPD